MSVKISAGFITYLQRKTASSDTRICYAVLLAAGENIHGARVTNSDIANASGTLVPTVIDVLKKYYAHGIRVAIAPTRNLNSDTARLKATGEVETKIIAKVCTVPTEGDADFVVYMEDILDVYQLPYAPCHPVWCMDEKHYQILDDSREPLPMRPGDTAKIDS